MDLLHASGSGSGSSTNMASRGGGRGGVNGGRGCGHGGFNAPGGRGRGRTGVSLGIWLTETDRFGSSVLYEIRLAENWEPIG